MRLSSSPCLRPKTRRTSSTCGKWRPMSARSYAPCSPTSGSSSPTITPSSSSTPRRRRSPSMSAARRAAISPAGNSTGRFQARSVSRSCASSTGGISMTHLGHTDPVLPIYVNAYLPPQPTMERCYAFGQAVARTVTALGLKTVVLASGGMSHFPGTDRYSNPELDWDTRALEKLKSGNLKSLIGYDETELDDTGNIELRCWACAAGALGERKPDVVSVDPSWHHNYASLAWTGSAAEAERAAHYPSIKPELVELTSALHGLAHDAELRAQYMADAPAFADKFQLPPDQREALIKLDMASIVKMGAHPLVPFLAQLQIQRLRPRS